MKQNETIFDFFGDSGTDWSRNAVIYEVNWRQMTPGGTLPELTDQLPRLKDLGVDVLWLMPIHPISELNRKGGLGSYYAVKDYKAVNPELGTLEQFKDFVKKAHEQGFKVIIDWVPNHSGCDNAWVKEHPDWYALDENGKMFGPFDWTDVYKFDYSNPAMRAGMIDAMKFWLTEADIDGFRCDMACEVPIDFWQQTLPALRKEYPGIYLLAEGEAPALHDGAFDASYAWELHHLLNDIAQGRKSAADLRAYVARDAAAMPREAFRLMFTSNHDENSWAGTEFERMGDAARVMAFLTFTLPNGQPLVYTGQEMGFDHRFEFFEKDPVPAWEHNGFTDFYTALIRLRHENPALAAGERGGQAAYPLGERTPDGLMLFSRTAGGNEVTVAANLSAEEVAFDLPFEGSRREFFTGKEYTGGTRTVLPAWQWLVFAQDRR